MLDTHTFLWFINNTPELSITAKTLIEDADNDVYLSIGSLWEIGIKVSIGKLNVPQPLDGFMNRELAINQIKLIAINLRHIQEITILPFHHRAPFDRMLIAQSIVEQMPIISADRVLDNYGVKRLW